MPWTVPSSPGVPCSALKTTSGFSSASRAATSRSMSSSVTLDQPRSRSASATPLPLVSDTSRSDDQPPIRTTTWIALFMAVPTRWISHSRVMWVFASTRRRTSSPSASISALVALPRLSRKLQCFSETWASPMRKPRQPAASISAQALWPGGFLKVEPPVRLRSGCDSSRARAMRVHLGADRCGSPGLAAEDGLDHHRAFGQFAVAIGVAELVERPFDRLRPSAARSAPRPGCP